MKIYIESLGCARNQVDSELMAGRFLELNHIVVKEPDEAEIIVINTCSFIESAINESIDTILVLSEFKKKGKCRLLIVTGCLPERFREKIVNALPEVDCFLGTGAFDKIIDVIKPSTNTSKFFLPDPDLVFLQNSNQKRLRALKHQAYIKIAEGCSKHCTYCIIPKLRGRHKSRQIEDIVDEAKILISEGAKELILVAQDSTGYGLDFKNNIIRLEHLLSSLSELSDDVWIRLLYGHPENITDDIINVIAKHSNICSYFDIPVQHASLSIIKAMGRNYSMDYLLDLFDKIRNKIPDAVIRTTLIVGFPGETKKDFEILCSFVEKVRFEHLGTFIYSDSKDLPSYRLLKKVKKSTAQKRFDKIMAKQAQISLEINRKYIGQIKTVIIDEMHENEIFIGRTKFQAPEVDGITYIHGKDLMIGSFVKVKITDSLEYDLIGEVINE